MGVVHYSDVGDSKVEESRTGTHTHAVDATFKRHSRTRPTTVVAGRSADVALISVVLDIVLCREVEWTAVGYLYVLLCCGKSRRFQLCKCGMY